MAAFKRTTLWCHAIAVCCMVAMSATTEAESLIDANAYRSLVGDKKAFRIGDTITIIIAEQTTAESRANTGRDKQITFSGSASDSTATKNVGLDVDSATRGAAVTQRAGVLRGQITATVVELNEIGHMVVSGQQQLVINGEEQSINVIGTLRPEDVDNSNTVLSSRLTNSRIEFTGKGIVSGAQKAGLIERILRVFGLN